MKNWSKVSKVIVGIIGGLVAIGGIGWIGLQVPPANFPAPSEKAEDRGMVAAPPDLPAPVRCYFAVAFHNQVPRVESMVAWGRARANFGLWMPLRFHLYHQPGQAFKREMEVTWFGIPVLKALDQYINGVGMTGPVGNAETGPQVNQGSNMILWAEAPFYPSLLITDPHIRWEAIDETSARLIFPFGAEEDELIYYFDPVTGLITYISAMRYQGSNAEKVGWRVEIQQWQTVDGGQVPLRVAITWANQSGPWSYWDFENIRWNVDLSQQLPTAAIDRPLRSAAQVQVNGRNGVWQPNP